MPQRRLVKATLFALEDILPPKGNLDYGQIDFLNGQVMKSDIFSTKTLVDYAPNNPYLYDRKNWTGYRRVRTPLLEIQRR